MRESRPPGSVRGVHSNVHPYRDSGCSGCSGCMCAGAERPESAMGEFVASLLIIFGQLDVLSAGRREVLDQFGINWVTVPRGGANRPLDMEGVPECDGGGSRH